MNQKEKYTLLDHLNIKADDTSAAKVYSGGIEHSASSDAMYSTNYDNKDGSMAIILLSRDPQGLEKRCVSHTFAEDELDKSQRDFPLLETHLMSACDYIEDFSNIASQVKPDEKGDVTEIPVNQIVKSYAIIVGSDESRMDLARAYLLNHLEDVQIKDIFVPRSYETFSVSLYDLDKVPTVTVAKGKLLEKGEMVPEITESRPIILNGAA